MLSPTDSNPRREGLAILAVATHAGILGLPLLLVPIFAVDWVNHVWIANYVAHQLTSSWSLPMFVNVVDNIGNPMLVFYGSSLYATLAPLVEAFGPNGGMRVAVFAALLIPSVALYYFTRRCLEDQLLACCATIVLSTSIYQLTNIYTRGAVTEFFAYQFLLFGFVVLMDAISSAEVLLRPLKGALGLASTVIGGLSHPPTAYLSLLFLGLPAAVFLVLQRRHLTFLVRPIWFSIPLAVILAIPLATSVVLLFLHSATLALSDPDTVKTLIYFPWSIDHWLARLLPWPLDFRVELQGMDRLSTPFLSAPVNTPALALLLYSIGASRTLVHQRRLPDRRLLIIFGTAVLLAAAASLLLSLPPGSLETPVASDGTLFPGAVAAHPTSWRGRTVGRIQFAYRLVNITNLIAICGWIAWLNMTRQRELDTQTSDVTFQEHLRLVLIVGATICALTGSQKVFEVYRQFSLLPRYSSQLSPVTSDSQPDGIISWSSAVNVRRMEQIVRHTSSLPSTQYGVSYYASPKLFPTYDGARLIAKSIKLRHVGASAAVATTSCERPCALMTDLVASPFFEVSLNDTIVSASELRSNSEGSVIILAPEGEHRIAVKLGTSATKLYAHSTLTLASLFWCSLALLLILRARPIFFARP